jgi:hypothetical protein
MDLLDSVRAYVNSAGSVRCWASMRAQTEGVRRHRLAYVLSTSIGDCRLSSFNATLLWAVTFETCKLQWLLNIGVCPNIAASMPSLG